MMYQNPLEIKPGRFFILSCVRKSEHTIARARDTRQQAEAKR